MRVLTACMSPRESIVRTEEERASDHAELSASARQPDESADDHWICSPRAASTADGDASGHTRRSRQQSLEPSELLHSHRAGRIT